MLRDIVVSSWLKRQDSTLPARVVDKPSIETFGGGTNGAARNRVSLLMRLHQSMDLAARGRAHKTLYLFVKVYIYYWVFMQSENTHSCCSLDLACIND